MHNSFESLQQKCRRYRIRRFAIRITPLLVLVLLVGAGGYFYSHTTATLALPSPHMPHPKRLQTVATVPEENATTPQQAPMSLPDAADVNKTSQTVAVPPSRIAKDINYILHVDADYVPPLTPEIPQKQLLVPSHPVATPHVRTQSTPTTITPPVINKTAQSLTMSFKQIDSVEQMQQLYRKEPSYDKALKIAQFYYHVKQYSNASKWAKNANILERERDGAWILYAKAEYAKGSRHRAIEILKLYLANAHSNEGDALLRSWVKGE